MSYKHPLTENWPFPEPEPWRVPYNHPLIPTIGDNRYRLGSAIYLPKYLNTIQDEKHHILQTFIAVKSLVYIIEEYDTPHFVLQYIITMNHPQISLPLIPSGQYDFTVDWGDGLYDHITRHDQTEATHVYDGATLTIVEERHQARSRQVYTNNLFFHEFVVTLAGVMNGVSFKNMKKKQVSTIQQWGCARIDVPRKPVKKTRCQLRLEMRRRTVHRCLERKLRFAIELQVAHEVNQEIGVKVDLIGIEDHYPYETRQCSRLSNLFLKWQPLGAEFNTNIQCNNAILWNLTITAMERRVGFM